MTPGAVLHQSFAMIGNVLASFEAALVRGYVSINDFSNGGKIVSSESLYRPLLSNTLPELAMLQTRMKRICSDSM